MLELRLVAVLKVTPLGKAPLSVMTGGPAPSTVTVKLPGVPTVKVVLLALVMIGAPMTTDAENSEVLPTFTDPACADGSAVRLVAVAVINSPACAKPPTATS